MTRTTGRCFSQFWRRDVQDPGFGRAGVCKGPFLVRRQPCCALHWGKAGQTGVLFESESCSVVSDPLRPCGLYSPWNSPGQNPGVGSLSLLQGIFPTQGWNPGLPHCRQILYQLSHKGSLRSCVRGAQSHSPRNWGLVPQYMNLRSGDTDIPSTTPHPEDKPRQGWCKGLKTPAPSS